ncbi:hypothetical protein VTO42DRAFT_605 [Malbranchea cinnamomea]
MRPESNGSSPSNTANGFSPVSNGTPASPLRKSALSGSLNGTSPHSTSNGQSNGSVVSPSATRAPTYFGHDREEVTRILIQALEGLGYTKAASSLKQESGYELENPTVAAFKTSVLEGQWDEAERILLQSFSSDDSVGADSGHPGRADGLILAEGADKNEMLFCIRQQKFLEYLERRDLASALVVLRQELTPLNHDIQQLHALSSLLMCPHDMLRSQLGWDGSVIQSRQQLLSDLSKWISPSVMIPEHRLATLLDHVKEHQVSRCLYHNNNVPPSLYSDHVCDRSSFPSRTAIELGQHTNEVWYLEFSHDGTKLVTTSRDCSVIIYDAITFEVIHRLIEHTDPVAYATWSPDDTKIISCSQDYKARLWDVETGRCLLTIDHHHEPVTSAAWAPDGESFVTGSLDNQSQLCLWSVKGQALYTWTGTYRVRDCAISADGRRLIAISTDNRIYVYNFITRQEEYCIRLNLDLTCINISRDSKYILVNMSNSVVQLLDIETAEVVRQYVGQKQGNYIIRSTFGGADENFVVSGSEDSKIYIWHKGSSTLVEALEGHSSGCVNAVAWNPRNPAMFASAGDDRKVRIWTTEQQANIGFAAKARYLSNSQPPTSSIRSTFNHSASDT